MSKLLVDTSAWIEYLDGSDKGKRVRDHLARAVPLVTGMIAAELFSNFIRKEKPLEIAVNALRNGSTLVPIDLETAHQAAHIYNHQRKKKPKFGIIDAHIVAAAKINGAKILTCNTDFLGLPEAIVIK